jgi:hypothetical protein
MILLTRLSLPAAAAAASMLAGCASTTALDTQWADPQFAGTSWRGARVLVACDAYDIRVKQACEAQMASELSARGATPVLATEAGAAPSQPAADQRVQAARDADARAILTSRITLADRQYSPAFSIGIGGFNVGSHGGVGVGVELPVGGGGLVATGHAAGSTLTDVASGRVVWSARATTPPSNDLNAQMGELAKAIVGAAQGAGIF